MPSNTQFPHNPYGLSSSYSRSEVQIDGMKVKFDKVADLVPAELTVKNGQAYSAGQSMTARSFGQEATVCTIYLVATQKFKESLDGWVESKSGYVASIRNYVEDIFQDVNGLKFIEVKVVDSLEIPEFNPLTDTRIHLRRAGGNAAYNFSNANVNVDFFGSARPGTAHGAAYLVAHEALHTYLIRLGVLLFAAPMYLSEDNGGHTQHDKGGKLIPNLNLEGFQIGNARESIAKYKNISDEAATFKPEFQRIVPVQLYFLKEYLKYIALSHPKFSLPANQAKMKDFEARRNAILADSAADQPDVHSPSLLLYSLGREISNSNAHLDFNRDPATVPFR